MAVGRCGGVADRLARLAFSLQQGTCILMHTQGCLLCCVWFLVLMMFKAWQLPAQTINLTYNVRNRQCEQCGSHCIRSCNVFRMVRCSPPAECCCLYVVRQQHIPQCHLVRHVALATSFICRCCCAGARSAKWQQPGCIPLCCCCARCCHACVCYDRVHQICQWTKVGVRACRTASQHESKHMHGTSTAATQ